MYVDIPVVDEPLDYKKNIVKDINSLSIGDEARVKFSDGKVRRCILVGRDGQYGVRKVLGDKRRALFGGRFKIGYGGNNYYELI